MNYPDSVRFLYALGNEVKTAKLGLERIGVLLESLGNPQQACRIAVSYTHLDVYKRQDIKKQAPFRMQIRCRLPAG